MAAPCKKSSTKPSEEVADKEPFGVRSSEGVILAINEERGTALTAFSINVEYFWYYVPRYGLMCAVGERIEDLRELNFQNSVGLTSDNFLTISDFYIRSTAINYDG